jgi:glycosyltransferase involved in cell wall biosynthesis
MIERKKRILYVGEHSNLHTGYSVYSKAVLSRLYKTGKYDIAELACYYDHQNPGEPLPWKIYPNTPTDEAGKQVYNSSILNEFGAWKFEETCLDFKPDIVFAIRDFWADQYMGHSPFRPFYKWVLMGTGDSDPQNEQWIATYIDTDAMFGYCDWGADLFRKSGGGLINVKGAAPAGADPDIFKPVPNQLAHKKKFGLPEDMLIVGTVMRNQQRKLYPNLIRAFAKFLTEVPENLARKTYLYLHTSFPDYHGWDLPFLIKEHGVGYKTLFSYICLRCGAAFPSFFQDSRTTCRRCGSMSAMMPSTHHALSRESLCEIMNLFDVYVQYATNEGLGFPMIEAASCGIPVFATDYSAMSDVVRKVKGFPIKVKDLVFKSETNCYWATPDDDDFIAKLANYLKSTEPMRNRKRYETRNAALKHYNWDETSKKWEDVFDEMQIKDRSETWESPPRYITPPSQVPANLTNEEFVRWSIQYVLGMPHLCDSYMATRLLRDLNWGVRSESLGPYFNDASTAIEKMKFRSGFNRQEVLNELSSMRERHNFWERVRNEGL